MALEWFKDNNFHAASHDRITQAREIVQEYYNQGYRLSLRQIYYQFLSRGYVESSQKSYKMLSELLKNARLAGLIDWDMIEDRARSLSGRKNYSSPKDAITRLYHTYNKDMWKGQDVRFEVWCEKDALIGVLEKACFDYDVNFFACKGFVSVSAMYEAAKRLRWNRAQGRDVIYLYLGDFDPSGMDIPRSIQDYLTLLSNGDTFDFRRIALNQDQIKKYQPKPFWAKASDSRHAKFVKLYGNDAYELDALEPQVLVDLIQGHIKEAIEPNAWREREEETAWDKYQLDKIIKGLK